MYWANVTEQELLLSKIIDQYFGFFLRRLIIFFLIEILSSTIHDLFRFQRNLMNNDTLIFFIGLKQINQIKQWESNV